MIRDGGYEKRKRPKTTRQGSGHGTKKKNKTYRGQGGRKR